MFINYDIALKISGLSKLAQRRQAHCVTFAKQCLRNKQTAKMFPINPDAQLDLRHTEKYKVNFTHTENYKSSVVPYCQRLLNKNNIDQKEKEQDWRKQQQARAREQERAGRQEEQQGPGPG